MSLELTTDTNKAAFNDTEYQLKLFSRIFYSDEFGERVVHDLEPSLFGSIYFKRISVLIKSYFDKRGSLPNISNIRQIINDEPSLGETEKQVIIKFLEKMSSYKREVENGNIRNDYEFIEETFNDFLINQKLAIISVELGEAITFGDKVKTSKLIDRLQEVREFAVKNDYGIDVSKTGNSAIKNPKKDRVPTGIEFIDKIIGGLPKGDLGLILAPSGVGKSTILAYISEFLHSLGKNVLHIVFDENDPDDIERKFMSKWSGISAERFEESQEITDLVYQKKIEALEKSEGKLVIKHFISEGVTVPKIRSFILKYQKRFGLKFDMVAIDYMDEIESHKDRQFSEWDGQTQVAKALKSLAKELNIPVWSAIQTKNIAIDGKLKFLDKSHAGGAYARIKKAQLIIGAMHESSDQQVRGCANFSIAKCNFAKAGNTWSECQLNNNLLKISEGRVSDYTVTDFDEDELEKKQNAEELKRQAKLGIANVNKTSVVKEDVKKVLQDL